MVRACAVIAAACALMLCAVQVVAVVVTAPSDDAPQGFTGSVVNEAGKPIAGAKVHVYGSLKTSAFLTTSKDGKFTYRPPAGAQQRGYSVLAVAAGYAYGLVIGDARKLSNPIVLRRERLLRGAVVDESGKPLEGVTVSIDHAWGYSRGGGNSMYELSNMPALPQSRTDKKGTFAIGHLPEPSGFDQYSVRLHLRKTGRADITKNLNKDVLAEHVRIVLPVGGVLEGKLLLPDKSGPPSGEWHVAVKVAGKWGSDHKQAKISEDGGFRIKDMPPGSISLAIGQAQRRNRKGKLIGELQPYALASQQLQLGPAETKSVELVLRKAASVKGTVVDSQTGKPIEGAAMQVRHPGLISDSYGEMASSDEKGEFSLLVPAGELAMRLTHIQDPQGRYYYFNSEDGPGATLTLAEGEQKTDMVVKVDMSQADSPDGPVAKATPRDFELIPGAYALAWDSGLTTGFIYSRTKSKPPAEVKALVKKLPAGLSGKAKFSAHKIDGKGNGGLVCVIVDGSKFYIDSNRNWDLSDDVPVEFDPNAEGYTRLSWVEVRSHQGRLDGRHTTHPIKLRPTVYRSPTGPTIRFERMGTWKGVLETNKGKAEFALVDFDCTGTYGDTRANGSDFMPTGDGDMVAIDTAARGKVSASYSGRGAFWFEPAARVASKFYTLTANDVGDSLTIQPFAGPLGQLDIKLSAVQGLKGKPVGGAYLLTPKGMYELLEDDPPFTVPAGPCRVFYAAAVLDSQTGTDLNIRYSTRKPIAIEPDKATLLEVAGDLSMAVEPSVASLTWQPGQTTDLNWAIKIGDSITVEGIGQQQESDAPVIKLFDAKGKMAAKFRAGFT